MRRLDALEAAWSEVTRWDLVRARARRLLEAHPLRAADALHLAAALIAMEEHTKGVELARDGWRVGARAERYRNRSTALDAPTCTPGSANGLTTLELRHDRRHPGEVQLKLKTRRSTLAAAPTGPLRVTLVLGAAPDAGATGLGASTHAFSALRCTASSNGARLPCA